MPCRYIFIVQHVPVSKTAFCVSTGMREGPTALYRSTRISSCLSEAIRSDHHLGREYKIVCPNPHSVQGMAASWAKISRVCLYLVRHVHFHPILLVGLFQMWCWFCCFQDGCLCPISPKPLIGPSGFTSSFAGLSFETGSSAIDCLLLSSKPSYAWCQTWWHLTKSQWENIRWEKVPCSFYCNSVINRLFWIPMEACSRG